VIKEGTRRPLVVAHRGSSGSAPENTMAAFRMAIEEGVDMIELDVRMTKDFELVVHHDADLRRTTNGSGFVWEKTLGELKHLDAGSWYSSRYAGERIPALREVIDLLPTDVNLNIEIKSDGEMRRGTAFEEACIQAIREKDFAERVLVSSFDHKLLRRFHKLDPAIRIGALYLPVRDAAKKPSTLKRRLGASAFICSRTQIRKRFVADARQHNIMIACYVINTSQQLEKMLRYGVDAVVTDFPRLVVRAVNER
jgi:glycerophosphoryl diester phosphodiesterase